MDPAVRLQAIALLNALQRAPPENQSPHLKHKEASILNKLLLARSEKEVGVKDRLALLQHRHVF